MKKILSNPNGFTLVELMVVVAIIGILSSVAVPQFRKYQGRAKQSEAKIALSSVYQTEVTALADYDTYASCIFQLGMETPAGGYYVVGFVADFVGTATTGGNAQVRARGLTGCAEGAANYSVQPLAAAHKKVSAAALVTVVPAGNVAQLATFIAGAAGNISAAVPQDNWTITDAKVLTNTITGF